MIFTTGNTGRTGENHPAINTGFPVNPVFSVVK